MGAPHFLASDFDFELPPELIAQQPAPERDQSRLLVLTEHSVSHHVFAELPELLAATVGAGALLVLNDTRVLPARLRARKLHGSTAAPAAAPAAAQLGGQVELVLCEPLPPADKTPGEPAAQRWRCMYRSSKPLRAGAWLQLLAPAAAAADANAANAPEGRAERVAGTVQVLANEGGGYVIVEFAATSADELLALLGRIGEVPLPPYIQRAPAADPDSAAAAADRERYQTVFARVPGSVAAPTAGLHFTPQVLAALRARGLEVAEVTLHVGPGTFLPMRSDDPREHHMHSERYHIPAATVAAIARARAAGRPVVAVGTTVVRTLESATPPGESVPRPGSGTTELFIYPRGPGQPQHRFQVVDALLTNFHLPRSTLLMLVAAFAGRRRTLAAYAEAVARRYRFFSFGDAMLIPSRLPDPECQPLLAPAALPLLRPEGRP
jgi:S-adenosylmethionine:tRNA ribosyltransferase-isomerase